MLRRKRATAEQAGLGSRCEGGSGKRNGLSKTNNNEEGGGEGWRNQAAEELLKNRNGSAARERSHKASRPPTGGRISERKGLSSWIGIGKGGPKCSLGCGERKVDQHVRRTETRTELKRSLVVKRRNQSRRYWGC